MKILIISGPNLNLLHLRDKNHYGNLSYNELNQQISTKYPKIDFTFYQSNHEGDIVDILQNTSEYNSIIINPAAYTHTSIAIRDSIELIKIPVIEVHLSDINNRDEFRKVNLIKDVVTKTFLGKQVNSYFEAIDYLASIINK